MFIKDSRFVILLFEFVVTEGFVNFREIIVPRFWRLYFLIINSEFYVGSVVVSTSLDTTP